MQAVLQCVPRNADTFGLLHNDVELDNLVWTDDGISILDFDEYGSGWYLLDIAKALTDLLQEGDTIDSPRIAAFIAGYRQQHPLDDMLDLLIDFLALSEFRGYMSLVQAIDLDERDAEVDWMRNMIRRLRDWMAGYEQQLEFAR